MLANGLESTTRTKAMPINDNDYSCHIIAVAKAGAPGLTTEYLMHRIYLYRSLGIYFLWTIIDQAFKWALSTFYTGVYLL